MRSTRYLRKGKEEKPAPSELCATRACAGYPEGSRVFLFESGFTKRKFARWGLERRLASLNLARTIVVNRLDGFSEILFIYLRFY